MAVLTPDELVLALIDEDRESVVNAMSELRQSLKNPPKAAGEYLDDLKRQGLNRTVERLREG